jgi:hypothetical protein
MNLNDSDRDDACRVHGKGCPFWSGFFAKYDKRGNFFLQLAQAANRDFIIVNNPNLNGPAAKALNSPDIIVKDISIVRDGRAVCASYCRHHPDSDFYDVVRDWFSPAVKRFLFDPSNPDIMSVRYEDVVEDQKAFIKDAGRFIGLEYPENFYKFWEFEHHFAAGNAGAIDMIRRFQNGKFFGSKNRNFYEGKYLKLRDQPEKPLVDERWKDELGDRELFIFDYFCGEINEQWGYPRDRFNLSQIEGFQNEIKQAEGKGPLPAVKSNISIMSGLRKQLSFKTLRSAGLHINPYQLKLLFLPCIGIFALSILLAALISYLLVK